MTKGEEALKKCGFELDSSCNKPAYYRYKSEFVYVEYTLWPSAKPREWIVSAHYIKNYLPADFNLEEITAIALRHKELNDQVVSHG